MDGWWVGEWGGGGCQWMERDRDGRGERMRQEAAVPDKLSGSRKVSRKQVVIFTLLLNCFPPKNINSR